MATHILVRTLPEWRHVLYKVQNSRDAAGQWKFSLDFETVDDGWPAVEIVGFSLAWYEYDAAGAQSIQGAYIPVGHKTGELHLRWNDVLPDLKALLEDDGNLWVAHNAKYDYKIAVLGGITPSENVVDTLLISWLLNTNGVGTKLQVLSGEGAHGLKDLSKWLLKHEMTELTDLAPREKYVREGVERERLRVDLVPLDDVRDPVTGAVLKKGMTNYAGDDAVQVLKLADLFAPQLAADEKTQKVYDNIAREFMFVLADMEMFGVELDVDRLKEMRGRVERELVGLKRRMYAVRVGEDFPAVADAALVRHLVEAWDDLDARFALPKDHPDYPKTVAEKGPKGNKTLVYSPAGKGALRKRLIDAHGLAGHPVVDKVRDDKLRSEIKAYPDLAHKVFNPASPQVLNRILFDEQGLAPIGEKNETTGMFSTKAEYVEAWKNQGDPMAEELDRLREIDKLRGTYLVGMVALVSDDQRIRGRMNQSGTRTGRLSMSDPNLQNQPNNAEFPIRTAFVATGLTASRVEVHAWRPDEKGQDTDKMLHFTVEAMPGNARGFDGGYEIKDGWVVRWWGPKPPMVLFVGDYSQLEIRLLAHESRDPRLLKAVREDQDIHALTAQAVFDDVPKDITLDEVKEFYGKRRKQAKPVNFGILYGMGPQKLANTLGITVEEAKAIIEERYMGFYTGVRDWIQKQHAFVVQHGYVKTAIGRKRHLPAATLDPRGETFGIPNKQFISKAKRQAQNTPIQGLASDLVGLAMRDLRRRFKEITLTDLADVGLLSGENGEMPHDDGAPIWGKYEGVRTLLQVHDEIIQESHPAIANWIRTTTVALMEQPGGLTLRVPIVVDAANGSDWYTTKQ